MNEREVGSFNYHRDQVSFVTSEASCDSLGMMCVACELSLIMKCSRPLPLRQVAVSRHRDAASRFRHVLSPFLRAVACSRWRQTLRREPETSMSAA